MADVGVETQIRKNNFLSAVLLILFPLLLLAAAATIWLFISTFYDTPFRRDFPFVGFFVFACTMIWFCAAWFLNTRIIAHATDAHLLDSMSNKRVYSLVEKLCISVGMKTPMVYVIEDTALNAFASGVSEQSYAITLSRGIIDKLNDEELEGVIAHELSHIINRDVRLIIISVLFVGIFSFLSEMAFRSFRYIDVDNDDDDDGIKKWVVILVVGIVTSVAYFLSLLLRFALSRKREYLADACAVRITGNPMGLANALRKIATNPHIKATQNRDIAQLFIDHPVSGKKRSLIEILFSTHPPISKRIALLKQFTKT